MTPPTVTVYLVRHGRTPLNEAGLLRGRIDTPLDDTEQLEARALGEVFAGVALTAVVSSPLRRARDTAAAIAAAVGLGVEIDPDLTDRDYGQWAGVSPVAVEAEFGSLDAAPGVEAASTFERRVIEAVIRAADRATSAPMVMVAHDAVNRAALAALVAGVGAVDAIPQRTGCWNRLQRTGNQWSAPIVDAVPYDGHRP